MANKLLVLSLAQINENVKKKLLDSVGSEIEFLHLTQPSVSVLENTDVLLIGGRNRWITGDRMSQMKKLHLIQTLTAGMDHIDFGVIPPDVTVCSVAGAYGEPIGEFVLGAVLSVANDLFGRDSGIQQIRPQANHSPSYFSLEGKKIGVIGTGGIGQNVARLAKGIGMITLGINSDGRSVPNFDNVMKMESLNRLLSESDVVVVAVPLTVKTRNLIGRQQLSLLKKNSILVNVARGAILNEKDLYEFLRDNPTVRAILDVWWKYPQEGSEKFEQDYPISKLPNVLSSPHVADNVLESNEMGSSAAIDNIIRYIKDEPLRNVVKKEDYLVL
jgi:phosphoglycerate dehydrogenase-like enzyme